ncbi:hypothetical protein CCP2SC5_2480003 [Azospirillaceae bacterium]
MQSQEQQDARSFQSSEAEKGRQFQGGLADKDAAMKREFFNTEQGNKLKEMDLAERQFAADKDTTEFNKRMAEIESGRENPGLMGGGGFLGTGLGGKKGFLGTGIGAGKDGNIIGAIANPIVTAFGGGGK